MLQLAKESFQLTRHAKECKDRSFTFFSPPFELSLSSSTSKLCSAKEAFPFLSLWHCYDIKHSGCTTAADMPAWIQHAFFCLTVDLLAAVVDARRTVDLFSQFGHIVGDGNHRSTCASGRFGLCLGIGGSSNRFHVFPAPRTHRLRAGKNFAQAFSSAL